MPPIKIRHRLSDIFLLAIGASILILGLLLPRATPGQPPTTVVLTEASKIVVASVRTTTFSSATTVTRIAVQTTSVPIVQTETVAISGTGFFQLGGGVSTTVRTSYIRLISTITYREAFSSRTPVYLTSSKELTQYFLRSEILAGTSTAFSTTPLILIVMSFVVFGGAYVRVHEYRTRLHIYYEILRYVAESPRIPSHIMRRCNLETRKFQKYIGTLGQRGFVSRIPGDGERFTVTDKALDYLRDRKLSDFIKELP